MNLIEEIAALRETLEDEMATARLLATIEAAMDRPAEGDEVDVDVRLRRSAQGWVADVDIDDEQWARVWSPTRFEALEMACNYVRMA